MNLKKVLTGMLAVVMVALSVTGALGTITAMAANEPDSVNNVYQITTANELLWAAENPDKNYMLTEDIDLSDKADWEPIGTEETPFSGSFNGAGHKITIGIQYTGDAEAIDRVGLFGYVTGTVANLTVDGTLTASIYSGYVGGIVANVAGGEVAGCTSNVAVSATGTGGVVHVGGVAGAILNVGNPGGVISGCVNNGSVNVTSTRSVSNSGGALGDGTNGSVGGVLGYISTFAKGYVDTSVNNGDITVTNWKNNIGGVVGQSASSNVATAGYITYCANKGDITVYSTQGERAAGIIGYIKGGLIQYCYNTGNVIEYTDAGTTVAHTGYGNAYGIFGYANLGTSNPLTVQYCYNASEQPLEAEICVVRNPQHGTFENFYMEGREEYETQLNANATAGTPGTAFTSADDLWDKISSNENAATGYVENPDGGYPLLYFEVPGTLEKQDYNGVIEKEALGNDIGNITFLLQIDDTIDTQNLTMTAELYRYASVVDTAAFAAVQDGESVKVGEMQFVAAEGTTLYSAVADSVPDSLWITATLTVKSGEEVVFTTSIENENAVVVPGQLPEYPDGTLSKTYNAGPGLASDQYGETDEDSEMVVISNTSSATYTSYVEDLIAAGYQQTYENEVDGNLYNALTKDGKNFYLYYTAYANQVRIIYDRSSNTTPDQIDTADSGDGSTEFYLYSLDYTNSKSENADTTGDWSINCGALMIVKLADNSLFVIDSGHRKQSSDAAQSGLMDFMYQITDQPYGSKINIKSWFISHAHGDHVYLSSAFLETYHDNLNIESMMYNIPSFQTMSTGYDSGTFLMKQSMNTYFPDMKFVKLHTGQTFDIQGVNFEVLHTHEDAVNENGVNRITDFNDTSTTIRLTIDGKTFILLGDSGQVAMGDMLNMYAASTLKSDVVQIAHHGYNDLADLYAAIDAPLAIVPNSEINAKDNNPTIYEGYAKPGVTVLFADPDTYKLTVTDGEVQYEAIPSYRENMDLYSVSDLVLQIGADQTQRNVTWYSDAPVAGKVQLALRSELTNGEFPADCTEFAAETSPADGDLLNNKATITGLAENTEYIYRVGTDDGWSPIYSFKTQDFDGDFSFLFAGDPQIGSGDSVDSDAAGWSSTLSKATAAFPDTSFVISAGDQVDTAEDEEQYEAFLSPSTLKSLAIAVNLGNHEEGDAIYNEHFNIPNVSELGASATDGSGDYWYIYNNTLFMSLNSNNTDAGEHKEFMQQVIDTYGSEVEWKVVTFHHSIYSVANHSDDADVLQRREEMSPIFSELDIDVVLMGHDHVYTRTYMMDGTTPITTDGVTSSVTDPTDGEVLYITGNSSSGSKYYDIQNVEFPYAAVKNQEKTPNITKIDVTDDSFTITTYRVSDMSVVDSFSINRSVASVTDVTVTPGTVSVEQGSTQAFTATVTGDNDPAQTVTWTVSGNNSENTTISDSGILTVAEDETAESLTVTATSTVDTTKSGTASVTVTPAATETTATETTASTATPTQPSTDPTDTTATATQPSTAPTDTAATSTQPSTNPTDTTATSTQPAQTTTTTTTQTSTTQEQTTATTTTTQQPDTSATSATETPSDLTDPTGDSQTPTAPQDDFTQSGGSENTGDIDTGSVAAPILSVMLAAAAAGVALAFARKRKKG